MLQLCVTDMDWSVITGPVSIFLISYWEIHNTQYQVQDTQYDLISLLCYNLQATYIASKYSQCKKMVEGLGHADCERAGRGTKTSCIIK